jgi:hypothetical protein
MITSWPHGQVFTPGHELEALRIGVDALQRILS